SNWQAEGSLCDFIKEEKVTAISEGDTRTLAITIRDKGEMFGAISTTDLKKESLLKKLSQQKTNGKDFIKAISVKHPTPLKTGSSGPTIAVLDLGMLNSFIHQLKILNCNVTLLPDGTSASDILSMRVDGLIISNGPENDISLPKVADTVKTVLGKIPMLGIATGHQVIGMAMGCKLRKLKIGHHGVNYPVRPAASFKGEITAQNHSYVIDENSLKNNKSVAITLRNVNDDTIEAMESKTLKFMSVQYNPASPGFEEINEVFPRFLSMAKKGGGILKIKKNSKSYREVAYAKA
ncbi:MAG: hypothetical protein NC933_02440, partial [Candidatus Omnitrophica bacterium]|nr:hypothetical protein [Candidatus Omnitrophota bacterium]